MEVAVEEEVAAAVGVVEAALESYCCLSSCFVA